MDIVLKSKKVDAKAKHAVLNDFLIFTEKNPAFQQELEEAIAVFSEEENVDVSQELANY